MAGSGAPPLQRRLTVHAPGCLDPREAEPAGTHHDPEDQREAEPAVTHHDPEEPCEASEIMRVFGEARERGAKVFWLSGKIDKDREKVKAFSTKNLEIMSNCDSFSDADIKEEVRRTHNVAWECRKGLKDSPNQDSFSVLIVEGEYAIYCVFDGHGPFGHDVSEFTRTKLVEYFLSRLRRPGSEIPRSFEEAFESMQAQLQAMTTSHESSTPRRRKESLDANTSGSTVTMAYHSVKDHKLWIAHVGDSRGVLGVRHKGGVASTDMTIDHKPNLEAEKSRIIASGGRVIFDGYYNYRVFARDRPIPGLNMSRALGDCLGHNEAGLSAQPDIREVNLNDHEGEVVLLLCTDGVWEFVDSKDAMEMVMGPEDMQKNLFRMSEVSYEKWMKDSDGEISDDITGIAVRLKRPGPTSPASPS